MQYGIMEWCLLAIKKGWQCDPEKCRFTIQQYKFECMFNPKFVSTSNHFACIQYFHATYADYDNTYEHIHSEDCDDEYYIIPVWADFDQLVWLYKNHCLADIGDLFLNFCAAGPLTVLRRSTSIDKIVDWFIKEGAQITGEVFMNAVCQDDIILLDVLWARNSAALPADALDQLIKYEVCYLKQKNLEQPQLNYNVCKEKRISPSKRAKKLLTTMKWLLEKGNKLDGIQLECKELASSMLKIDPRAAQIFYSDPVLQLHISEK